MLIRIDQKHADPGTAIGKVIQLAIREQTPFKYATVMPKQNRTKWFVRVDAVNMMHEIELPQSVVDFATAFDNEPNVVPFEFDLIFTEDLRSIFFSLAMSKAWGMGLREFEEGFEPIVPSKEGEKLHLEFMHIPEYREMYEQFLAKDPRNKH